MKPLDPQSICRFVHQTKLHSYMERIQQIKTFVRTTLKPRMPQNYVGDRFPQEIATRWISYVLCDYASVSDLSDLPLTAQEVNNLVKLLTRNLINSVSKYK